MCGIAGILQYNSSGNEREATVRRMTDALKHRGPDAEGFFSGACMTLGHRRLSIIDLSSGGQPMAYDGVHIVFNGEIYNFRVLREDLLALGHSFETESDTEVILHAFVQWGPSSVNRLTGMFAYAIWDSRNEEFYLFRDRVGIKPLFYASLENGMAFSSEIASLLKVSEIPRKMDQVALADFMMFGFSFGPRTAFQGIRELPKAHWLKYSRTRTPEIQRYWDIPVGCGFNGDFTDAVDTFKTLINQVVKDHLVSDVPVSTFLSGGIDSSTITALSQKHYSGTIEAFSISFPDAAYDEIKWAKAVAGHIGIQHNIVDIRDMELTVRDLEKITWHVGQPFADSSCLPTYFVCKEAGRSFKVVQSGDGADELFGGYNTFEWIQKILMLKRIPGCLRRFILAGIQRMPGGAFLQNPLRQMDKALSYSFLTEEEMVYCINAILDPHQVNGLTQKKMIGRVNSLAADRVGQMADKNLLRRMAFFLFHQSLPQDMLQKVDRMSMRASIEVRVPFLDHRVVEFAFSLPNEFHVQKGVRKRLIRESMADVLPAEVFTHRKQGFSIPLHCYYSSSFLDEAKALLCSRDAFVAQIFSRKAIEDLLKVNALIETFSQRHMSRYTWTHILWMLLQIEVWARQFRVTL